MPIWLINIWHQKCAGSSRSRTDLEKIDIGIIVPHKVGMTPIRSAHVLFNLGFSFAKGGKPADILPSTRYKVVFKRLNKRKGHSRTCFLGPQKVTSIGVSCENIRGHWLFGSSLEPENVHCYKN